MGHQAYSRAGRRLLLALAPLLLVLEVPGAVELMRRPEVGFRLRHDEVMVVTPESGAARAGLRPGDHLRSFAGQPIHGYADLLAAQHLLRVGEHVPVAVERKGNTLDLQIELGAKSAQERLRALLLSVSALCFLFLGFVTYRKRDDALGRTFYITCLLLAYPFLDLPTVPEPLLMRWAEGLRDGLLALMPAFLLRFVLIFPDGASRHYARQRWLFVAPALLLPLHFASHFGIASAQWIDGLAAATAVVFAVYVLAAVVAFARKTRQRSGWSRTSKLHLAWAGLLIGVVPLTVATLLHQFAPGETQWLDPIAVLFLPLVPASFSLALLRSGAIDITYLTRQFLVSFFLTLPLLALAIVLTAGMGPALPVATRVAVYLGVLAAIPALGITVGTPARFIARVVDRALYPEQRRVRAAAAQLGRELSEQRHPAQVLERLRTGLSAVTDSSRVRVLTPGTDTWSWLDDDEAPRPETEDPTLRRVCDGGDLVETRAPGKRSGASLTWGREAELLCPLMAGGRAMAVVVIDGRRSANDYRALHLFHIQSLCRQAAAALENASLHEEDLARERDRTELALAEQIQVQLLPQEDLILDQVQVCGVTEACRSVGGDLFDHFRLSDGRVIAVVADASGKGVPAALLTSGLRTAVRETLRPGLPLEAAIAHVNAHVCGMTGPGNFIALFVAMLDPADGLMEYCVAGIEPALWHRIAQRRSEWLNRGGPVLGIDATAAYRTGTVRLDPGDLVLAYSDGLVDEEDAEGEEFGRARLLRAVEDEATSPAREGLEAILRRVRAHRAGEAVDDTTLLIVRRNASKSAGTVHAAS